MDKADSFNASFDEDFCGHLEFHLCRTFDNSDLKELRGFWCDGVSWAPYYNADVNKDYLSLERVLEDKKIITTAHLGKSGQDYYEMTLLLGQKSLKNCKNGLSLKNCLPAEGSMRWVSLDVENKKIELRLL